MLKFRYISDYEILIICKQIIKIIDENNDVRYSL